MRLGKRVPLPFEGNVFAPITDPRESGALFNVQGWVQPARVLAYDPATGGSTDTGLIPPSTINTSAVEAREVFAVSYDGTRIPLSILYRKGLELDGARPTILIGYGSYGLSLEAHFTATNLAWLERGAVLAIAHVRGGGELGEGWHRAGQMATKINTILDFIACGEYLVDQHYTSPRYLAGEGGSAGGITVGGALTWRPDLFGVILDLVGVSDSLRSETEPNGPPNVSEFGSVKDVAGFHGLYAMAAYHHVRDGTAYPAVMFSTGANDPRVAPWQMAKMAARVQAASTSGRPVLLRVDYDAGHGIGSTTSQHEQELADLWAFTLWQMGDPQFQPAHQ
jgi:prolyl oligopeptidase